MDVKSTVDLKRFDSAKAPKIPLFESARLFCDLVCLGPGQEQKPHDHADADKLYFVVEGCGIFSIGGEVREIGERNVVAAPAGVIHGVKNETQGNLVLLVVRTR